MKESAPQIARRLLRSDGSGLEVLRIHQFHDDASAHDDDLQAQLAEDFTKAFDLVQAELASDFGCPGTAGTEADQVRLIPWCGIYRSATWRIERKVLYLCAAHEDRELPYLLLIGTVPGSGK